MEKKGSAESFGERRGFLKGVLTSTAVWAVLQAIGCSKTASRSGNPTLTNADFTVRQVREHQNGQPTANKKSWRIDPAYLPINKTGTLTVKVLGVGNHELVLYPPDNSAPVPVSNGKKVSMTLKGTLQSGGYYDFDVTIDGEYAEANSSPGVIIE